MNNLFSTRLLAWFDCHGRKDLPWQKNITPYSVWISETMLQQTQVKTVVPYFQRFMQAFPTINSLANANEDEVLHLWTGLGYYARARNLHKAAKKIMLDFQGEFPNQLNTIMELPGIGRSTAGAILAIAFQQRATILDGNVKRVLTRFHAIIGWPGLREIEQSLWQLAESHTPTHRIADYTQAIMDLGATVCTRSRPFCSQCPLQTDCIAYKQNLQSQLPTAKPAKNLPTRRIQLLILMNSQNEVLLEKRPPVGIWGGLWSLPECAIAADIQQFCQHNYGYTISKQIALPKFTHTFSHFHLEIQPIQAIIKSARPAVYDNTLHWYSTAHPSTVGLPAPIKKLLAQLGETIDVT